MVRQATMYGTFESTSIARRSDPESSKAAASEITANGTRDRQKSAVLDAVKRFPGRTSLELSVEAGIDRYVIARRLSELRLEKLVVAGDIRICEQGNRKALTWFSV